MAPIVPRPSRLAEERAAVRLVAVVVPARWPLVEEEVLRRTEVFTNVWRRTTISAHPLSPRAAALESVYQDVIRGWL